MENEHKSNLYKLLQCNIECVDKFFMMIPGIHQQHCLQAGIPALLHSSSGRLIRGKPETDDKNHTNYSVVSIIFH